MFYKLPGIFLILFSVIVGGYFWRQSDMVESAMLIKQGSNKMTVLQGTKKITANSNQDAFLNRGLISLWSFNGMKMNWGITNNVLDSIGSNNASTTNMSTTTSPTMGKVGQALSFDGVNDYVKVGSANLNMAGGNWTFAAWIKTKDTTGAILCKDSFVGSIGDGCLGATSDHYILEVISSEAQFEFEPGDSLSTANGNSNVADGKWHHVVGVRRAVRTAEIWVDGVMQATATSGGTTGGVDTAGKVLQIGAEDGINFLSGSIDEVRVYNRPLTAAEIGSLWQAGR